MKYQEYGIIAKPCLKSISGFMYILPKCKNMNKEDLVENQHWVSDPGIVRSLFYSVY